MSRSITDRTLALAGLFQAVSLVNQVARRAIVDQEPFETSIRSLFVTDPVRTEDVYGGTDGIAHGMAVLLGQLDASRKEPRNADLTRYAITVLHLERKLSGRRDLLDKVAQGLSRAERQAEHFAVTHENVIASLADTYLNTVSTLSPRVMVTGEHGHLNHPKNANRVRALLLAAMRSAVLWNQNGGSRLQLLLRRKTFVEEARRLVRVREVA